MKMNIGTNIYMKLMHSYPCVKKAKFLTLYIISIKMFNQMNSKKGLLGFRSKSKINKSRQARILATLYYFWYILRF